MSKYKTEQRKKLALFFESNPHKSYTAQDIYENLGHEEISMSAIYRNLSEMIDNNTLCKVNVNKSTSTAYQYVDHKLCNGIIHLKCEECEKSIHLNKSVSQMIIDLAQEEFSFNINGASAILYGKCEKCSKN